ncbi:MBL fold metallo-hydrolase [Alteromonadaceae bacterium M269]|nr:MBL fold metallo-hydrolase [Alteromonadaceae bacterium M269]
MKLTFYGVRGSIPTPGKEFAKYGGNTACVHIELNDGTDIILDAGTGIKNLGTKLAKKTSEIHLLLTHNHWDHIQGFPFFAPIYQADRVIHITPGKTTLNEPDAILTQMSGSVFPVNYQSLSSDIRLKALSDDINQWNIGKARISRHPMNHPGGGSSFVIEEGNTKIAYITDNELYPPYKKESDFLEWVEFAAGADLIIHDAQYMISDMPAKSGWGHSVAEETVKLAMAARAKKLALYSHDHIRTDSEIEKVEAHCQSIIEAVESELELFAAKEGLTLEF